MPRASAGRAGRIMISLIPVIVPGFVRPGESHMKDGCMTAAWANMNGLSGEDRRVLQLFYDALAL